MALLKSTWLCITLPWFYFTLLESSLVASTLIYTGSTSLYLTPHNSTMDFTLLDSTLLYNRYTSLHLTLYISLPWLYLTLPWFYFTLPDSTLLYHGSTSFYLTLFYHGSTRLYLTLHCSTLALLHPTSLHIILPWLLPWLYFTSLGFTLFCCRSILQCTWLYITLLWLYLTLHNSTLLYYVYLSLHYSKLALLHTT